MSVMFKTQQGRTLVNDDMKVDDVVGFLGCMVEIVGWEVGHPDGPLFHVNTRHVVEWWDPHDIAHLIEPKS